MVAPTADTRAPATPPRRTDAASVVELKPELLAAYKRMLAYQFSGTVALVVVLATALLLSYAIAEAWDPPILSLVTLSGMLGAFFSALTRLYNVDQLSAALITPTVSKLDGWHLVMYSFVPPLVGAISAVVLYVGFVSGLVAGDLFPDMSCKPTGKACSEMIDVLRAYGPSEADDYGKALVWAFAAGFSERLVPDTLQSLVAKAQREEAGKSRA